MITFWNKKKREFIWNMAFANCVKISNETMFKTKLTQSYKGGPQTEMLISRFFFAYVSSGAWCCGWQSCSIWSVVLWVAILLDLERGVVGGNPARSEAWCCGWQSCSIWSVVLWVAILLDLERGVVGGNPVRSFLMCLFKNGFIPVFGL